MYRRVNSGRFIGLTTFLIVVVMAIFTWVMWGMAHQVLLLSDVIVQMNANMDAMTGAVVGMSADIEVMNTTISSMATDIHSMSGNVASMDTSISGMTSDISVMAEAVPEMNAIMLNMSQSVGKMSYDLGLAAYAFSQPMSYMWGNVMPF